MTRVEVVDRWVKGTHTRTPPDAKLRAHSRRDISDPCVDGYLLTRVQHSDDKIVWIALDFSASDHVRSLGPGEEGLASILAAKKSTDWGSTIDASRYAFNSHPMIISFPRVKADPRKRVLLDAWPLSRRRATMRDVLSICRELR